jgi:F/Y rich C-terminus
VTLEGERPDICFTGASPNQCWDLIKERLDAEFSQLPASSMRTVPGPVSGLEMFGFTAPNIIRVNNLFILGSGACFSVCIYI